MPPRRQNDQGKPKPVGPTGTRLDERGEDERNQAGALLTTAQGPRLPDTDHAQGG